MPCFIEIGQSVPRKSPGQGGGLAGTRIADGDICAKGRRPLCQCAGVHEKKYFHEEKFKSRSAGFDVQNYYLQKEKEQLAAEKKSQELELSLRDTQLRSSLVILVPVFFLVVGLVAGLYQQRQAKRKLAAQNALIQQQAVRMENLDVAKSRFFANVSHELHTPLTLLLGPIHALLKENRLTGKQTQMLQMARRSGIQLEQWINDLR